MARSPQPPTAPMPPPAAPQAPSPPSPTHLPPQVVVRGSVDWRSLHLWQIQWVRDVLVLLVIIGVIYLGYLLRVVTVPMLLALALAYLFEPLVRAATRTRYFTRPGMAGLLILLWIVGVMVPVALGVTFAVVQGVQYAGAVARNVTLVQDAVRNPADAVRRAAVPQGAWDWIAGELIHLQEKEAAKDQTPPAAAPNESTSPAPWSSTPSAGDQPPAAPPAATLPDVAITREQLAAAGRAVVENESGIRAAADLVLTWIRDNAGAIGRRAVGTGAEAVGLAFRGVTTVGQVVFGSLLTAFFFYFFCTGWGRVLSFWESLIPERRKGRTVELIRKMDRVIAGFVRGRLTISFLLMIFITSAYWSIGVPMPLILGPIVGLLVLVPFGQLIGMPLAMLALWLQPSPVEWQTHWWWIVFAPMGVYVLGQCLDDYVLNPAIQGKHTDMDTPTILFASLAGGALAGIYGLLIAIPTAACIKILLKESFWPRFKAWAEGRERDFLPIGREDGSG